MRKTTIAVGLGVLLGALLVLTYGRVVKAAPVEARWFIHPEQPIYVRNLECHEGKPGRVLCTAVVENTSHDGIASTGEKWEQLGEDRRVLDEMWTGGDCSRGDRPNREFEGKGEIVL
ncbi:MAG: hypothetical protein ACREA0_24105, partial [bacterium]